VKSASLTFSRTRSDLWPPSNQIPSLKALEQKLEQIREFDRRCFPGGQCNPALSGAFDVQLVCRANATLSEDVDVTKRCWPVTVTSSVGVLFYKFERARPSPTSRPCRYMPSPRFFAFELTGRASGEERQVRFVLNLPLVGAPAGRREQVLRSLVGDRSRMLRFLCFSWLMKVFPFQNQR